MKIQFAIKNAGRESLAKAIGVILKQDDVYSDISTITHATAGYIVKCSARQRIKKGASFVNIRFNVTGAGRRAFAQAVGEILAQDVVYNGTPGFTYTIGSYTIDREGALICPADADPEEADRLMVALYARGYEAEPEKALAPEPTTNEPDKLVVEMPDISTTSLSSLKKIISSKETLFKKAFNTDALPIETDGSKICFPWFTLTGADGEVDAYSRFIVALCDMAKNQSRVTAKEREVDNEKFAMRIFLVRLGFVGPEFKAARKILLRNLTGNSSWKSGSPLTAADEAEY